MMLKHIPNMFENNTKSTLGRHSRHTSSRKSGILSYRLPLYVGIHNKYIYPLNTNNLYVVNTAGQYVYFYEVLTNSTRYSVQLNSFFLPTSAQATTLGYTKPSSATWNYPATAKTPQLTFGATFGDLVGFDAGTYPSAIQTSNQEFLSTKSPKLNVVDNYVMTCNMISNADYSIPSDILFTIPLTAGIGSLINVTPAAVILNHIAGNHYKQIVIKFFSQNFEPLELNDTELTLTLVISDDKDREVQKLSS